MLSIYLAYEFDLEIVVRAFAAKKREQLVLNFKNKTFLISYKE